ncbi:MAG TPA: hypothetical protein VGO62_01245, partial [Myxococcota bacterium]
IVDTFVNGARIDTMEVPSLSFSNVGDAHAIGATASGAFPFFGTIDEVRVVETVRSDDFILLDALSRRDALLAIPQIEN